MPAHDVSGSILPAPIPSEEIAIIGIAGRFPEAADLESFWNNLESGRDSIREIPVDRWDHREFYDADRDRKGKTYGRWGGFLDEVAAFDPLFFKISPTEARRMDPQERIFLESAWTALEDAGYTPRTLREALGGEVGVFAGVMWSDYQSWGQESLRLGGPLPSSSFASIANRVSWLLDLSGPSMAVDTMCSSSLTALHLACQSLLRGECTAALAGGVNLLLHPQKYLYLAQERFLASDGRCRSFGEGGDGYVPGEGVGVVMLRPLADAVRTGDRILGVIRATAVRHGGHTHGYTVPSPRGQADLIGRVLDRAGVAAESIGYIEAHGTGTALGDPIEIRALESAFRDRVPAGWTCPVGSVKANIGHLESASGIAALARVLLQFRAGWIAPSLHTDRLNPNIEFESTPFRVSRAGMVWPRRDGLPRRAAISSFGAGGANAHLIVEEGVPSTKSAGSGQQAESHQLFLFSDRSDEGLMATMMRWRLFLDGPGRDELLADMAWTLQIGRVHFTNRLAIVAGTHDELIRHIETFVDGRMNEQMVAGHVEDHVSTEARDEEASTLMESFARSGELIKLARIWVLLPVELPWELLHAGYTPRRTGVPAYVFGRQRCWVVDEDPVLALLGRVRCGECAVEDAMALMEANYANR
jgi:acyl transferase domain-containing protein